ncbi:MAG: glycosyltransferase [Phycisphaerae bacterium]
MREVETFRPDLVFFFKSNWLDPATLAWIADRVLTAHYHPDDYGNPENVSRALEECIPLFGACFTTKSFNVAELLQAGARDAYFVWSAFDPAIHHPVEVSESFDICFVGVKRPERSDWMRSLVAELPDARVAVAGPGWRRSDLPRAMVRGGVYGAQMSALLNASKVCLGFLNHANRDQHTCRTFEIPACGGLLVAERSSEHLQLFSRGGAILFDGPSGLVDACRQALAAQPKERRRIKTVGHSVVMTGGHTYGDRARQILDLLVGPGR